ncbi:SCP2 sterol-binding domain-containing protein [Plantactinospora sp. WMMC1484]|uniref:SCP2 sterol-binding domain-containing protein n=1 Tax=Plantactinospora sp. WMMC1484 TaxID=3404122 RepID=UPI003BF5EA7F
MADPTADFFAGEAQRRAHLLPQGISATVRLDLSHPERTERTERTEHWYVTLREGEVAVSREADRDADCIISTEKPIFDRLVLGANPVAATLRNDVTYQGSPEVLIYFERLLPGPPDSVGPTRATRAGDGAHGR